MGKTKKIISTSGSSNPFGIKTGANGFNNNGFNIGQQMLKGKVQVKSTKDKRKSVRVPIKLYDMVFSKLSHGKSYPLMTEILTLFSKEFEKKGTAIIGDFENLETRPIKISEEAFKILKVFKFETDESNLNIIASALAWYLENEKNA